MCIPERKNSVIRQQTKSGIEKHALQKCGEILSFNANAW